jgi:hypothetical protein
MFDFQEMSNLQLAELIKRASTELRDRLSSPFIKSAPDCERPVAIAPPKLDQDFVEACIRRMRLGRPVLAAERNDYKRLRAEYEAWFHSKGYPADTTGTNAKAWMRMYGNQE